MTTTTRCATCGTVGPTPPAGGPDRATVQFIADALARGGIDDQWTASRLLDALAALPPEPAQVAPGDAYWAQQGAQDELLPTTTAIPAEQFDRLMSSDEPDDAPELRRIAVQRQPSREWGVRHTTGLTDKFDSEDEARAKRDAVGWDCCMPGCSLVSRVPGGEWEPVDEPEPDRFSVAEIEAAWDEIASAGTLWMVAKPALLAALRAGTVAGREGEQG